MRPRTRLRALRNLIWLLALLALVATWIWPIRRSLAALYWASAAGKPVASGVRGRDISVCFVGNAVTARPM